MLFCLDTRLYLLGLLEPVITLILLPRLPDLFLLLHYWPQTLRTDSSLSGFWFVYQPPREISPDSLFNSDPLLLIFNMSSWLFVSVMGIIIYAYLLLLFICVSNDIIIWLYAPVNCKRREVRPPCLLLIAQLLVLGTGAGRSVAVDKSVPDSSWNKWGFFPSISLSPLCYTIFNKNFSFSKNIYSKEISYFFLDNSNL